MNKGRGRTNKPPPRPPISQPSRLRKYSDEHLAYEVNMLRLAASLRVHSSDPTLRILVAFFNNARVESFAQHLRNLIVFLYRISSGSTRATSALITFWLPDLSTRIG